jgi:hypothetical protein
LNYSQARKIAPTGAGCDWSTERRLGRPYLLNWLEEISGKEIS